VSFLFVVAIVSLNSDPDEMFRNQNYKGAINKATEANEFVARHWGQQHPDMVYTLIVLGQSYSRISMAQLGYTHRSWIESCQATNL
jgi:hypothetical protein